MQHLSSFDASCHEAWGLAPHPNRLRLMAYPNLHQKMSSRRCRGPVAAVGFCPNAVYISPLTKEIRGNLMPLFAREWPVYNP